MTAALRSVSDYAWRGLVIAAAVYAAAQALIRLKVLVLPLLIALLLATVLVPLTNGLERQGLRRWAAAAIVFVGFLAALAALVVVIVPPMSEQFGELGETVSQGVNDIEAWLVEGPLGLSTDQLDQYRERLGAYARNALRASSGQLLAGAVIVAETVAGSLLTLIATFFLVKDGPKIQAWVLARLPRDRREVVAVCAARAWGALGGFLRGAAAIGVLEGAVMGITLALVGVGLAVPVAVLTFIAAFFPVLGAILAGIVATLVALVSGGVGDAAIVAVVAVVVQQFDNDLLAPVIYGKALRLHPLVVISSLTAGATLGGIIGAFLAVPLTAVVVAVSAELWRRASPLEGEDAQPGEGAAQ